MLTVKNIQKGVLRCLVRKINLTISMGYRAIRQVQSKLVHHLLKLFRLLIIVRRQLDKSVIG